MDIWKWRPKDTFEYLQLTLSSHELTLVNSQCSGPLPPVARLKRENIIKSQERESKTEIQSGSDTVGTIYNFLSLSIMLLPNKKVHPTLLWPLPLPLHGIAIAITTWQITKCARACPISKVRPLHQYNEIEKIQEKNLLFQNWKFNLVLTRLRWANYRVKLVRWRKSPISLSPDRTKYEFETMLRRHFLLSVSTNVRRKQNFSKKPFFQLCS